MARRRIIIAVIFGPKMVTEIPYQEIKEFIGLF